MFTYLDPAVRERLIDEKKLIRIDADGRATDPRSAPQPGARAISILGPIPLPLHVNGRRYDVQWYASVRHTELSKVQDCTAICAPHAGQLAAVFGLHNLHDWKIEKSDELANRAELIREAFAHPELRYRLVSAGAYFAYVQHPFDETARDVVKRLIQDHELVCLPGSYFGPQQEQFIRLAFANVHESNFPSMIERLLASQQRGSLRD